MALWAATMVSNVSIEQFVVDTYVDEETGVTVKVYESGATTDNYELQIRKLTREYIARMQKKWPNKFTYELTRYTGQQCIVKLTCAKHRRDFQAKGSEVIRVGDGCPECAGEEGKILCLESFIICANQTHNNKYDYKKADFTSTQHRCRVICPEHGEFLITPWAHVYEKKGCAECDSIKTEP